MTYLKLSDDELARVNAVIQTGRNNHAWDVSTLDEVLVTIAGKEDVVTNENRFIMDRISTLILNKELLRNGINSHHPWPLRVGEKISKWIADRKRAVVEDDQTYVLQGNSVSDFIQRIMGIFPDREMITRAEYEEAVRAGIVKVSKL